MTDQLIGTKAHRIMQVTLSNPDMVSREIAEALCCREEYVRSVWQRNRYSPIKGRRGRSKLDNDVGSPVWEALEQLFLAITEEGLDVEAAISRAERVLYGDGGAK